jgi:hypothetical protein
MCEPCIVELELTARERQHLDELARLKRMTIDELFREALLLPPFDPDESFRPERPADRGELRAVPPLQHRRRP